MPNLHLRVSACTLRLSENRPIRADTIQVYSLEDCKPRLGINSFPDILYVSKIAHLVSQSEEEHALQRKN